MAKIDTLPSRAIDLIHQVGDGIKNNVPDGALKWLQTGAALGVLKTGSRVATGFVRRNPAVAVASLAGAGALWYMARRHARKQANAPIQGTSKRIEAKRNSKTRPASTTADAPQDHAE